MNEITDIRQIVLTSMEITNFQRKVYLELLKVPRGGTITYGELAERIGCKSAQDAGQALRHNPFAPQRSMPQNNCFRWNPQWISLTANRKNNRTKTTSVGNGERQYIKIVLSIKILKLLLL